MFVFGSKRPASRPSSGSAPASAQPSSGTSAISPTGRRFEMALLVAGLPAAAREECIQRLLPLVEKRPAWNEDDVGDVPAEQCRCCGRSPLSV